MAGAILGLLTGGVLGIAGQKYHEHEREQYEEKQFNSKAMHDALEQHPDAWMNPGVQKAYKKLHGEESFNVAKPLFDALAAQHQRQQQQAQQFMQSILGGG